MNHALSSIRRTFVRFFICCIYLWGSLWYDKDYLVGKHFDRQHFSDGWKWILRYWFGQKVLGKNRHVPWPCPADVHIASPKNIVFDPDDMHSINSSGAYFQGIDATISIGHGTEISLNTGFITANHDMRSEGRCHLQGKPIVIGDCSWVGMNAVILPGVTLGAHTVVGAGAIVTKSFPEGHCVIAGNPARKIKDLE